MDDLSTDLWLVCRVQARLCALPLDHVVETLRALPIEPVAGTPEFVLGLSVVRGTAVPVVDVAQLLGAPAAVPARFVIVTADNRRVALALQDVLGVRRVTPGSLQALPALLHEADTAAVASIGLLDAELMLVLRAARLVPAEAWALASEAMA